jgi:hypothetical protein
MGLHLVSTYTSQAEIRIAQENGTGFKEYNDCMSAYLDKVLCT